MAKYRLAQFSSGKYLLDEKGKLKKTDPPRSEMYDSCFKEITSTTQMYWEKSTGLGFKIPEEYIVIDCDDKNYVPTLDLMFKRLNLKPVMYFTKKGAHYWFNKCDEFMSQERTLKQNLLHLSIDILTNSQNCWVYIKFDNESRIDPLVLIEQLEQMTNQFPPLMLDPFWGKSKKFNEHHHPFLISDNYKEGSRDLYLTKFIPHLIRYISFNHQTRETNYKYTFKLISQLIIAQGHTGDFDKNTIKDKVDRSFDFVFNGKESEPQMNNSIEDIEYLYDKKQDEPKKQIGRPVGTKGKNNKSTPLDIAKWLEEKGIFCVRVDKCNFHIEKEFDDKGIERTSWSLLNEQYMIDYFLPKFDLTDIHPRDVLLACNKIAVKNEKQISEYSISLGNGVYFYSDWTFKEYSDTIKPDSLKIPTNFKEWSEFSHDDKDTFNSMMKYYFEGWSLKKQDNFWKALSSILVKNNENDTTKYVYELFGTGNNGKTVLLDWVVNTIGTENAFVGDLINLDKNKFQVINLLNKLIAVQQDHSTKYLSNVGMLKSISGGDRIGFEVKNKTINDANFKPRCKLFIPTNDTIPLGEKSDAIYNRFIYFKMMNDMTKIPYDEKQKFREFMRSTTGKEMLLSKMVLYLSNVYRNGITATLDDEQQYLRDFVFFDVREFNKAIQQITDCPRKFNGETDLSQFFNDILYDQKPKIRIGLISRVMSDWYLNEKKYPIPNELLQNWCERIIKLDKQTLTNILERID